MGSWLVLFNRRSAPNRTSPAEWQCPPTIEAASTGFLLSAMLRLVRVRGLDGTGLQSENDRSLKPVLRLQVTDAHGRVTASSSSAICDHRAVRHITMTSALPRWTPKLFCLWTTWTHGIDSISTWCNVVLHDPVIMPDAMQMDRGGIV